MTLYDRVYEDFMNARRARDPLKAGLLGTLIGEAQTVSPTKTIDDETMLSVVKKFIKNGKIAIEAGSIQSAQEAPLLEVYLPMQLTEDQLLDVANDSESMPAYMSFLKATYPGQYDGKLAAQVWKDKVSA